MKDNYTHIAVVLDRSGSMGSCKDVTIEGLNSFIRKQQEVKGEGTMTLVQFDDRYEVDYEFKPLSKVPMLTDKTYQPRGWTALLDAIGRTIDSTGRRLADMPENKRPSRVIFVIQTDGMENHSTEYVSDGNDKGARVRGMIKHQQEKYNWDFIFLGAGQDAIATASQYGINAKSALSYSTLNSVRAFAAAANYTTGYRSAQTDHEARLTSFTQQDRDDSVATNTGSSSGTKRGHHKTTAHV